LREAQPEICAEKLVALLHSWNLKATRLALFQRDPLYSYEFNFAVYGESAKIFLNSERFNLSFANGRTQADLQTIAKGLVGFSECFPSPEIPSSLPVFMHMPVLTQAPHTKNLRPNSVSQAAMWNWPEPSRISRQVLGLSQSGFRLTVLSCSNRACFCRGQQN